MKTALSLFWRALVVQLLFSLVAVLALSEVLLPLEPWQIQMKPTVALLALAVLFSGIQAIASKSVLYFVFGRRLGRSAKFWAQATYALAVFYFLFAALNVFVAQSYSMAVWLNFKTFAQLPAMALFLIAATPRFDRNEA